MAARLAVGTGKALDHSEAMALIDASMNLEAARAINCRNTGRKWLLVCEIDVYGMETPSGKVADEPNGCLCCTCLLAGQDSQWGSTRSPHGRYRRHGRIRPAHKAMAESR
jgi:ferredoxin-like protein FixX